MINQDSVRDFCCLRLAPDSTAFLELAAEFEADPVNSRVGAYCRETEQIVRAVTDEDLNWEAMLNDWEDAEQESEGEGDSNDSSSRWGSFYFWEGTTRVFFWFCAMAVLGDGIHLGMDWYWPRLDPTFDNLSASVGRALAIRDISSIATLLLGLVTVAWDFRSLAEPSMSRGNFVDGILGSIVGALLGFVSTFVAVSLLDLTDPDEHLSICMASVAGFLGGTAGLRWGRAFRRKYAGRELTTWELLAFFTVATIPLIPHYVRSAIDIRGQQYPVFIWLGVSTGLVIRLSVTGYLSNLREFDWYPALKWSMVGLTCGILAGTVVLVTAGNVADNSLKNAIRWAQIAMCIPVSIPIAMSFFRTWRSIGRATNAETLRERRKVWVRQLLWISLFAVPVAFGYLVGVTDFIAGLIEWMKKR